MWSEIAANLERMGAVEAYNTRFLGCLASSSSFLCVIRCSLAKLDTTENKWHLLEDVCELPPYLESESHGVLEVLVASTRTSCNVTLSVLVVVQLSMKFCDATFVPCRHVHKILFAAGLTGTAAPDGTGF